MNLKTGMVLHFPIVTDTSQVIITMPLVCLNCLQSVQDQPTGSSF
jgi:hypothetical protein